MPIDFEGEITLGKDEYIVLGDKREDAVDSRDEDIGIIKRDQIRGKVIFKIYKYD